MIEYIDAMPPGDFLAAVLALSWITDRWTK